MTKKIRSLIAPLGFAAALALVAGAANATCAPPWTTAGGRAHTALHPPVNWSSPGGAVRPEGAPELHELAGLWKIMLLDPDGTTVTDFGYVGVSDGGSETMISFGRAPETGDACIGAWKRVAANRYKVSHYAPIYGADNVTFGGTLNLIEELKLAADGESFTGTLAYTGYDPSGNIMFQFPGLISATRVRVDTPAP